MPSNWIATGVVAAVGSVVLLVALLAVVLQQGQRRAALVAGLAPAAMLPAVVAVAFTALQFSRLFAAMAVTGEGGAAAVLAATQECWQTVRLGFGLTALASLVGLVGGLLRFGQAPPGVPDCSVRRAAVLGLLPLLALLVAGLQARELRLGVGIAHAVVTDTGTDDVRKAAVERYLEAHDLATRGSAGIADISQRIARAVALASVGGGLVALILLGLAVTGTILAWPVRVGPLFVGVSSGFWLLSALAAVALALGLGAPPTF